MVPARSRTPIHCSACGATRRSVHATRGQCPPLRWSHTEKPCSAARSRSRRSCSARQRPSGDTSQWRTDMTLAPDFKVALRYPDRFFIGGEWVQPSSSALLDVFDSHSEEVFLRVAEAQAPDIDRAVTAAQEAFDRGPWPRMS